MQPGRLSHKGDVKCRDKDRALIELAEALERIINSDPDVWDAYKRGFSWAVYRLKEACSSETLSNDD